VAPGNRLAPFYFNAVARGRGALFMTSVTAVPLQPVKRGYIGWLGGGVVLGVAAAVVLALTGTAPVIAAKGTNEQFLAWNQSQPGVHVTASGLQYQVLKEGEGPAPTDNDVALVNYVGRLRDGRIFDRSQQPTPMPVRGMIPGFSEALKLMHRDAKYRVWVKPELAYGDHSPNPEVIPANSLLVFDIDLKGAMPMEQFQQMMQMQRMGGAGGAGGPPPGGAQ
jgi:FKBP-type peptidyl-prolyl cis-trans isomerase FkpA